MGWSLQEAIMLHCASQGYLTTNLDFSQHILWGSCLAEHTWVSAGIVWYLSSLVEESGIPKREVEFLRLSGGEELSHSWN